MKKNKNNINGWLVVDKPLDISSAKAVAVVKRLTNAKKVGHAGTLDPLASGILPIALGEATKTVHYVMDDSKSYEFTVKFGQATSTDDLEGEVVETSEHIPSKEEIVAILPEFVGEIEQVPPAFSAIKVNGKRAYDLARSGQEVALKSRIVRVDSLVLNLQQPTDISGEYLFSLTCGKGTYVRSLARDIALKLGSCGHVTYLRRTKVGNLNEKNAISLAKLEKMVDSAPLSQEDVCEKLADYLLPVQTVLDDIPVLPLDSEASTRLRNGLEVTMAHLPDSDVVCAFYQGVLLAICSVQDDHVIKPIRVFNL